MSDQDRGAYTPYSRDDLAFDPRSTQRRRPFPLTLAISAVVLVVMGGAAVMFYQSGVRGVDEPPRAVGTPVGKIKTAVNVPAGQPADPAAMDVYVEDRNAPAATTGAPVYTADPEQPQPRTAAVPTVVSAAPLPAARPAPAPAPRYATVEEAVAAAETDAPPARPVKTVKAKPVALAAAKPVAKLPAKAPAKPTVLAAATPAKPKPTAKVPAKADAKTVKVADAKGAAAAVQIGAFSSKALADQEFGKLRATFAKYLSGKGHHVDQVQRGGSTLWRAAYTGFSRPEAQAFCGALKAAGRACIIK